MVTCIGDIIHPLFSFIEINSNHLHMIYIEQGGIFMIYKDTNISKECVVEEVKTDVGAVKKLLMNKNKVVANLLF